MTIRIFVGCAPNHEDAESQAVLEWSIRKYASEPVDIEWMKLSRDPKSFWYSDGLNGWQTSKWATPFSGFRWGIPERCNYEGKAIYTDSDVIVLSDIAELWNQKIPKGKLALAKGGGSWRYCVSLWNCAAFHPGVFGDLQSDPSSHGKMTMFLSSNPDLTGAFEGDWNCLDGVGHSNLLDGKLKALHYTDMSSQPHLRYAIPRLAAEGRKHWFNGKVRRHPRKDVEELFDRFLQEAINNGYAPERYMQEPLYGEINKQSLTGYRGRATA